MTLWDIVDTPFSEPSSEDSLPFYRRLSFASTVHLDFSSVIVYVVNFKDEKNFEILHLP
jgi:hypothetical protein